MSSGTLGYWHCLFSFSEMDTGLKQSCEHTEAFGSLIIDLNVFCLKSFQATVGIREGFKPQQQHLRLRL